MGRSKGRCNKKNRPNIDVEGTEIINAPHSFVLHRGLPCIYVTVLTKDFRRMMEPFTASALRERKNNKIKDFVSLSGVFHVSHMCIFQKSKTQLSFKIARLPRGPTLSFKVHQFTLAKDVIGSMKKQYVDEDAFHHAPLVILNNFTGPGKHLKLMATTFQNMYPTINLATVQLSTMKRCVLVSYNPVTDLIDIRHFAITVAPIGLNRGIKKVVLGKVPNLAKHEDIADFIIGENAADSEYEDDDVNQVVLPQTLKSRGNIEDNKSAIKLHEIGPRITLELTKIEDGLFTGEVLYHQQIIKTEKEITEILEARRKKKELKEARKRQQEQNTMNKSILKNEQKQKSLAGMKRKSDETNLDDITGVDNIVDDDVAYYREEVGEEPDNEVLAMIQSSSNRMGRIKTMASQKRRKMEKIKKEKEQSSKKDKRKHDLKTNKTKKMKKTSKTGKGMRKKSNKK